MGEKEQSRLNATETFSIPDFAFERLKADEYYTVRRLVPFIIAHYVSDETEEIQKEVKYCCGHPKIYDFLENKILELNRDLTDGERKIRWCRNPLTIPERAAFFRSVFPTFNIAKESERTGTIAVDIEDGVLN